MATKHIAILDVLGKVMNTPESSSNVTAQGNVHKLANQHRKHNVQAVCDELSGK